jgi:glycylpeptide N-tetradecanoyltransferase
MGDEKEGAFDLTAMKDELDKEDPKEDASSGTQAVYDHAFWSSQPVPRMDDPDLGPNDPRGAIVPSDVDAVPKEALRLPDGFEWASLDLTDGPTLLELYTLLKENYVEDSGAMFRFEYSQPFIQWAMMPPGFKPDWHVGVRVATSRRLVAFIGATPAALVVHADPIAGVEVNFLCVHKKLREKRLAPVLIREVTRRCNLAGIFQASYTAGVVIPKPVGRCQYWHRSLNVKKLIEVGFSSLGPRSTMSRAIKVAKLPDAPQLAGFRPMVAADVPACCALLNAHLARFMYYQHFDELEFAHWLLPRDGVVYSYVVAAAGKPPTDFVSFYNLPSSILNNRQHPTLTAAYSYYTVAKTVPLETLLCDAMTVAVGAGFDVFNMLDLQDNAKVMHELKFAIGDGKLQYYVYNWRCPPMSAEQVGLILL